MNNFRKRYLVIVAHPDDEILGCGGTLAKLIDKGHQVYICYLSIGEGARDLNFRDEKLVQIKKIQDKLKVKKVFLFNNKDNDFSSESLLKIIKEIESVKKEVDPHIILTHSKYDLNIDHTLTNKAVHTAFRALPQESLEAIYAFEVLSSTEYSIEDKIFKPNYFEEINHEHLKLKQDCLMIYTNEIRQYPHPRSIEGIEVLAKYRGMQSGLVLAEAFILEKQISRIYE